jgi:hypothetical protein
MEAQASRRSGTYRTARLIRERIESGGERLWRMEDFSDQPFMAVAQALSRLAKAGFIERLSKGVYYKGRETSFGKSRPNPASVRRLAARDQAVFPSGVAAAGLLGFTTQTPRLNELATSRLSLPRKLVGEETVVHTRRPEAWNRLSEKDAALLDFLRGGGKNSELSPEETTDRTLNLLSEEERYERLARVADTEPPRVRALLGALGELLEKDQRILKRLRVSLNPLSRFDFGMFADLPNARSWQAKEKQRYETV